MHAKPRAYLPVSFLFLLTFILHSAIIPPIHATEDYAADTGKGCAFCHQEPASGELNAMGFAYQKAGYTYPIPERVLEKSTSLQKPFQSMV